MPPTDRSNSPAIISTPTPSAGMPTSGITWSAIETFAELVYGNSSGIDQPVDDAPDLDGQEQDEHVHSRLPQPIAAAAAPLGLGQRSSVLGRRHPRRRDRLVGMARSLRLSIWPGPAPAASARAPSGLAVSGTSDSTSSTLRLVDQPRASGRDVGGEQPVLQIEGHLHDRHEALRVRLLVDGGGDVAVLDPLHDRR